MPPVATATLNSAVVMMVIRPRSDWRAYQRAGQPSTRQRELTCASDGSRRLRARGDAGRQPVACAAHGLQALPPERSVDLAAQVAHVDLDHVGVAVVVRVPYVMQYVGLADRVARATHEELQQREL